MGVASASGRPEPDWLVRLRMCRVCQETRPPLAYQDPERKAYPLFHKAGNLHSPVVFVMEAPNWTDTFDKAKGHLTIDTDTDPTGVFFRRCLAEGLSMGPEDIYLTNSVLCLPAKARGGSYPARARQQSLCAPRLAAILDGIAPHVVATLGAKALQALNRISPHSLTLKDAGRGHDWNGRIVFPMGHPSRQGRHSPTGRGEKLQLSDYHELRKLLAR
jgi:uracil-DNA glycosylase